MEEAGSAAPEGADLAKLRPLEGTDRPLRSYGPHKEEPRMNGVIYLIGLVVVVLAILSFLGLS